MSHKMLIDASHSEETRVVIIEGKKVEDFDFESLRKTQLSGNIYLAKVTRVEPSLQAAFLDYGGNRHGFLAFSEVHPDYYQVPLSEKEKETLNNSENKKNEITKEESDNKTKNEDCNDEFNENLEKTANRKFRIQEVIKVRQILLVQIVKEERGNKGAALTTFLSLAGRYCVLMPNTPKGGGISRKITNITDRKRLKEVADSLSISEGAGLIIRTAGSKRTKLEIKRDYEFLIRQWEQIRDLTMKSIAPTSIYEEGSLIKRSIRDLYTREVDEILVEGERGYKEAKNYMKMLMPSHAKNVKKYEGEIPLFFNFQVEDHLAAMFNPIVQLKSGGYIVIGVTEALVAVDVNSGRATRESCIEETALKTNLEAADELVRQLKLRDLAGLIVVDFIDMEERKNNFSVEKRVKDKLKNDRARTQVGRISSFGLLEMSRQRLRPGMIETTTQACIFCHGTGITRSDDSLALAIFRDLEEEGLRKKGKVLVVKAPLEVSNYMLNEKREHISLIENRYGLKIKIEGDTSCKSPNYNIELKENEKDQKNTNSKKNKDEINDLKAKDELNTIKDENQNKRKRRRRRKKIIKSDEAKFLENETSPNSENSKEINEKEAKVNKKGNKNKKIEDSEKNIKSKKNKIEPETSANKKQKSSINSKTKENKIETDNLANKKQKNNINSKTKEKKIETETSSNKKQKSNINSKKTSKKEKDQETELEMKKIKKSNSKIQNLKTIISDHEEGEKTDKIRKGWWSKNS